MVRGMFCKSDKPSIIIIIVIVIAIVIIIITVLLLLRYSYYRIIVSSGINVFIVFLLLPCIMFASF